MYLLIISYWPLSSFKIECVRTTLKSLTKGGNQFKGPNALYTDYVF